ncbi:TPA: cation-translocating P-type ATPase [Candidatus Avacholeplasma faecigallinarum]|nr:cation-translocating P-type ATPase [Candidatus Avacholeplasma faecigallinarum]
MEINKVSFERLDIKETEATLKTDLENGLKSEEVEKRQAEYGKNELVEKKRKSWIMIFLSELNNPMIFVLFGAIAVTIGLSIYETVKSIKEGLGFSFIETGDWPDVIIILAVIILNAVIGTVQEIKAETSLEALKKMSSPESTVIRDGKRMKVKSSDLTIGDIVILEEGDTIGADLRLVQSVNLKVNESSLTGESVPVEKDCNIVFSDEVGIGDRINSAYMSTTVTYGRGMGVVVRCGMQTEIGRIASAISESDAEETPLQKVLAKLSKILGILTLAVVVFVLLVDIIWIFVDGKGSEIEAYMEAILSSISLAVAAIPEGLPAVVTIVLAVGVQRMVRANTVVRKLPSVETLGAVSVVCSDKTGTLTQNRMTVVEAYVDDKFYTSDDFNTNQENEDIKLLAKGMSLCSNATVDEGLYGDPTEIALVVFANQFELRKKALEDKSPRVDELPFDSVRKMMSTKHVEDGKNIIYTKGALDSILKRTTHILDAGKVRKITDEDIEKIYNANSAFSDKALRVLALAYNNKDSITEEDLTFVGLVAMIDPPRPEAKPAVEKFKKAGIITVMITGDHKDTAFAVAKELGICETKDQCITGADVDAMSEEQLKEACKNVRVFARVSPENKVMIVKAFQGLGNICAMTGDGVNDAPSLKAADIGIAMGITGTDVAKGAADMVLTDDNFASIEKAVEEGRGIYANIRKTVFFLLGSNISEVLAMFILICIGLPAPLIAIHLLWVNLITDSLPAIALGMQAKDPNCMNQKPRNPKEGIFAHGGVGLTVGYGAVITISVLISYLSCAWLNNTYSFSAIKELYSNNPDILHQAQTMAFTTLAFAELFHMIGMSNPNRSFVHVFKDKNLMMLIAFIAGIVLQLFVIETPGVQDVFSTFNLSAIEWVITAVFSIMPLIVHEIVVLVKYIKKKSNKEA